MTTFDTQMDSLAKQIAGKAMKEDTPLEQQLDAFKQLTLYYGLLMKHRVGEANDDSAANFANFSSRLNETEENVHGRPAKPLPGRRERAS